MGTAISTGRACKRIAHLPVSRLTFEHLMTPIVTNEAITMPESSNQKSSTDSALSSSGHRSTLRAPAVEHSAIAEQSPSGPPSTEVFAVYGVEPEIQAYAMAKYSRSALSMKESLREIKRAEGGKVSQYFLLSVWSPVDCRPGAHCAGSREALDSSGDRVG